MVAGATLPLKGITVIDLTEVWAGPMGTSLLGDLGARVIKVESFPRMSNTRAPGSPMGRGYTNNDPFAPRPYDRSATHNMANRNKYGVTLNLTRRRGLEVLKKLVKLGDVFVESYSAGTGDRLGVGYADIREIKPDVIMVSMPGWGVEGPYKGYVSLGSGLDAFTGHHALRGYPDTDPTVTGLIYHADAVGAASVAFAVLIALHHRNRTGEGQWIDMSQVEAFLPHLSRPLKDYIMNQRQPQPLGNRDYFMAPHGCYRCLGEDDWVVITVSTDEEWSALCKAMGDPEKATSENFADALSRHEHQDELDALIQEWTSQRDMREVMHLLQEVGVPAEAVLNHSEMYADPHLEERGFFQELDHTLNGRHRYPGYLWKYGKMYEPIRMPPNCLGEHNEYVYGTLLGISDEDMKELEAEGIIGTEFPDS